MALIKCNECGKEISDKANVCIHCGCPTEPKEETVKCAECGSTIKANVDVCEKCGCPVEKKSKKETKENYYDKEIEIDRLNIDYDKIDKWQKISIAVGVIGLISLVGFFFGIMGIVFAISLHGYKRNNIILTNKRIKGTLSVFGSSESIDIPLDKIDSITCGYNWMHIERLMLTSNTRVRGIMFSTNTDAFCETTLKEIEKYKKYVYRREI